MSGRGFAIGSNEKTAPLIEQSFKDGLDLLEKHLAKRQFLLGGRPSMADFGIAPQLYEALIDPTAGEIMRNAAPAVVDWCKRILDPKASGDFESWTALKDTLQPFLKTQVQKYHVKSLTELRRKRNLLGNNADLDIILEQCGCREALAAPQTIVALLRLFSKYIVFLRMRQFLPLVHKEHGSSRLLGF